MKSLSYFFAEGHFEIETPRDLGHLPRSFRCYGNKQTNYWQSGADLMIQLLSLCIKFINPLFAITSAGSALIVLRSSVCWIRQQLDK